MRNLDRRHFLQILQHTATFALLPASVQTLFKDHEERKVSRISEVRILKLSGTRQFTPGVNRQHQVQPQHLYNELRPKPYSDNRNATAETGTIVHHYIEIVTEDGLSGLYGYVDPEAIKPILAQLRPILIGQNALAIEKLWDILYRRNRHSRAGHYMMALSAVDNALWDLRGKYFNVPVCDLLGGSTRNQIPVYGSCLGFSVEKGLAGPKAESLFADGFAHQKWFLAYGPGDGTTGLQKNIDLVQEIRDHAGPDLQLMFDAFMGWDYPYALAWCKAVEKYHPHWLEEAFPTNRINLFEKLSQKTEINIATGEHFYNRWEVLPFLQRNAIQFVQADPEWCGGVSELIKICHLASTFGAKVYPHGHNIPAALHVVASQSPEVCPLVEYLINYVPGKLHFQKNPPLTMNGQLSVPTLPGFGIELDEQKIEKREQL